MSPPPGPAVDDPTPLPNPMEDHVIRLRGGWTRGDPPSPGDGRVTLPLTWPVCPAGPVRLVRRFQAPRVDPASVVVSLTLEDVAGLLSVELNGRTLARPGAGCENLTLD